MFIVGASFDLSILYFTVHTTCPRDCTRIRQMYILTPAEDASSGLESTAAGMSRPPRAVVGLS